MERIINFPREVRNLMNFAAPRVENEGRNFELDALALEEDFGLQFPRRHILDRENPLELYDRPGEFR